MNYTGVFFDKALFSDEKLSAMYSQYIKLKRV